MSVGALKGLSIFLRPRSDLRVMVIKKKKKVDTRQEEFLETSTLNLGHEQETHL